MLHVASLAIVIVYDMQLGVTKGKLDPDWNLSFPVDLWTFIDVLISLNDRVQSVKEEVSQ